MSGGPGRASRVNAASSGSDLTERTALSLDVITGVEPLGTQFGAAQPLYVPRILNKALFGPQDVGAAPDAPPLHTYAVLDAARIQALPERLAASGLAHDCLFQGQAAEDLRDVAPWLVKLRDDNSFTRDLFTSGDRPQDLWDLEPGIFLRSPAGLGHVRRHLRRFTKVRNLQDQWVYFRFWEGFGLSAYLETALDGHLESLSFLGKPGRALLPCVITRDGVATIKVHRCAEIPETLPEDAGQRLTAVQTRAMEIATERHRRWEIVKGMRRGFPDETASLTDADLMRVVEDAVHRAGENDIRAVRHVHVIACWQLIYGSGFETRDPQGILGKILRAHGDEGVKVKHLGDRLSALHRMGHL